MGMCCWQFSSNFIPLAPPSPCGSVSVDSWQTASASSFSPTFGGGTGNSLLGVEASLSVLADGSAGFEPPAPPTVESDHGHRPHFPNDDTDNSTYTHHHSSSRQRGSSGMDGSREGRDEGRSTAGGGSSKDSLGEGRSDVGGGGREGGRTDSCGDFSGRENVQAEGAAISPTEGNHPGDYHRSTHGYAVAATAAVETSHDMKSKATPKVPRNGSSDRGGTGVLRGVSAAMASGALPVAARPNPNASSAVDLNKLSTSGGRTAFPGDEVDSDRLPHVGNDDTNRASGRRLDSAGLYETAATGASAGEGGVSGFAQDSSGGGAGFDDQALPRNWRQDERREQARRHIDQALRQRALRRSNRCATIFTWIRCGGYKNNSLACPRNLNFILP